MRDLVDQRLLARRTPPRRGGAATARRPAACRRGRRRSRAGTPRSAARRRRSAGSSRSRSPPGDRGEPGVDAVQRHEQLAARRRRSQSGSRAYPRARRPRPRSRRPRADGRAAGRASSTLALVQQVPDRRRGHALEQRHRPDVEAEPRSSVEVAPTPVAEPEVLAGDHDLGADRPSMVSANSSGSIRCVSERELDHERLLHPELGEQLEAPFEGREQLDPVPEHAPRVRVEGDDGRRRPGGHRRLDHAAVAEVDAVERAESRPARGFRSSSETECATFTWASPPGRPRPAHRRTAFARPPGLGAGPSRIAAAPSASTSTAGRNGSASAGGRIRSSSASSTEKGPTSSRRSVRQCPPSASAIERTYVPDPTRRSRRGDAVRVLRAARATTPRAPHRHLDGLRRAGAGGTRARRRS